MNAPGIIPCLPHLVATSISVAFLIVTAGAAERPNILLILPDQMRASAMGCDGNRDVQTPNIDRLAADGMTFKRTYGNVPVCCPARAILLTGTYQANPDKAK